MARPPATTTTTWKSSERTSAALSTPTARSSVSDADFWKVTMRKNSPVTSGHDEAVEQEDHLERLSHLPHPGRVGGCLLPGERIGVVRRGVHRLDELLGRRALGGPEPDHVRQHGLGLRVGGADGGLVVLPGREERGRHLQLGVVDHAHDHELGALAAGHPDRHDPHPVADGEVGGAADRLARRLAPADPGRRRRRRRATGPRRR